MSEASGRSIRAAKAVGGIVVVLGVVQTYGMVMTAWRHDESAYDELV